MKCVCGVERVSFSNQAVKLLPCAHKINLVSTTMKAIQRNTKKSQTMYLKDGDIFTCDCWPISAPIFTNTQLFRIDSNQLNCHITEISSHQGKDWMQELESLGIKRLYEKVTETPSVQLNLQLDLKNLNTLLELTREVSLLLAHMP